MAKVKLEDDDEPRVRSLPDVNFLDFAKVKVDALLEEALPGDRQRLRAHLAKNALGFVLVTAVSNLLFTFLPLSCLRFQQTLFDMGFIVNRTDFFSLLDSSRRHSRQFWALGKTFGTAPTNVAIDNLARRLDSISRNVTERLKAGKGSEDRARFRRTFVLRLKYSPTCLRLLAVARGEITWQEYESGTMVEKAVIKDMFRTTLKYADILCTTPALGCRDEFRDWREEKAQAILLSWGPYFTNRYMSKVKYGIETRLKSQILT
nr:hypothetical protein [Trichoderma atroviride]